MKNLKSIVFFGTYDLAVPALETLAGLELTPRLIVTHPRPASLGADGETAAHPVREWAEERGIDLVRSRRALEEGLRERIGGLGADLLLVVDYGRPLPAELLEAASCRAIEVQPSLLPNLRGAHALRGALSSGLSKTGVTVIEVNEEPWAGPILLQEELEVGGSETYAELLPRARELVCQLLTKALKSLDRSKGKPRSKPQKTSKTTASAPHIGGRHHKAPWSLEAKQVYDRLRAYTPPGLKAYFKYRPVEILSGMPMEWVEAPYGASGTYLGMRQGKLAVLCGDRTIFGISRLRRPGADPQGAADFAYAEQLDVGDRFA